MNLKLAIADRESCDIIANISVKPCNLKEVNKLFNKIARGCP